MVRRRVRWRVVTAARRPQPQPPRLITVEEAAAMLSLSKMSIYRRIKQGLIVGYRLSPHAIRVDADSVDRFLADARIVPDWAEW